jgi:hypothetical protein
VASADLPVTGQVIKASSDTPYLALKLEFTPNQIFEVLSDSEIYVGKKKNAKRAMFVSEVEPFLLDAVIRLARLLEHPKHTPVLAPLFTKEILYWILQGPKGEALEQMAIEGSNGNRIREVTEYIINNYDKATKANHISREYSRMFGLPPREDMNRMRENTNKESMLEIYRKKPIFQKGGCIKITKKTKFYQL